MLKAIGVMPNTQIKTKDNKYEIVEINNENDHPWTNQNNLTKLSLELPSGLDVWSSEYHLTFSHFD